MKRSEIDESRSASSTETGSPSSSRVELRAAGLGVGRKYSFVHSVKSQHRSVVDPSFDGQVTTNSGGI